MKTFGKYIIREGERKMSKCSICGEIINKKVLCDNCERILRKNVPCFNCEDRHPKCHANCEKYKIWSEIRIKNREELYKKKLIEWGVCEIRKVRQK